MVFHNGRSPYAAVAEEVGEVIHWRVGEDFDDFVVSELEG